MNKNMQYNCGYVALIGCPNVGKSTILNKFLKQKISITSRKPQTTQKQILAVKTADKHQIIFTDTPGLHQNLAKHQKGSLNKYMSRSVSQALADVDLVLFVVSGTKWHDDDEYVLEQVKQTKLPCVLIINKTDLVPDKAKLLPFVAKITEKYNFIDVVYISATKEANLDQLEQVIVSNLPQVDSSSDFYFPADYVTDQNQKQQAAEVIREKVIRLFDKEIPYEIAVAIEEFKQSKTTSNKDLLTISAVIWVARKGQKVIIIGNKGESIKRVGQNAREDLEKILNTKVHLNLWVKVKSNWSSDDEVLKSLGFDA